MAGLEAIGAIGSATGATGVDLNAIWAQYQQQVSGVGVDPTGAVDPVAQAAAAAGLSGSGHVTATQGADFAQLVGEGLLKVDQLDRTQTSKALQAATGDLKDVHDYVIAAQQASTAVALTTTLRDKALEAFNEIMRMPL